jgi:hypothetical protein
MGKIAVVGDHGMGGHMWLALASPRVPGVACMVKCHHGVEFYIITRKLYKNLTSSHTPSQIDLQPSSHTSGVMTLDL